MSPFPFVLSFSVFHCHLVSPCGPAGKQCGFKLRYHESSSLGACRISRQSSPCMCDGSHQHPNNCACNVGIHATRCPDTFRNEYSSFYQSSCLCTPFTILVSFIQCVDAAVILRARRLLERRDAISPDFYLVSGTLWRREGRQHHYVSAYDASAH